MSVLSRKVMDGAAKVGLQLLVKNGPQLMAQVVRGWNQLVLRGEYDRVRADIRREFTRNREVAGAIYRKYQSDMQPDVRAIFESMIADRGDAT